MLPKRSTSPEWLTIKQAASMLDVHPATLRRWADDGEIPVMITPGGHRRFSKTDVSQFAEERRQLRVISGLEQMWADRAMTQAREGLLHKRDERWLAAFTKDEREQKRLLGRRLMGLILQYISLDSGGEDFLSEARAIGRQHAEDALGQGLPLTEAMQATLFFRDTLVEVAIQMPGVAHVRPEANTRLLRRINAILNAVQLAIAETYDGRSR